MRTVVHPIREVHQGGWIGEKATPEQVRTWVSLGIIEDPNVISKATTAMPCRAVIVEDIPPRHKGRKHWYVSQWRGIYRGKISLYRTKAAAMKFARTIGTKTNPAYVGWFDKDARPEVAVSATAEFIDNR